MFDRSDRQYIGSYCATNITSVTSKCTIIIDWLP